MISSVNSVSPISPTLLSDVCKLGDIDFVILALKKGAQPDSETLTLACRTRNVKIVDLVLAQSAMPDNETLKAACLTNDIAIVQKVLDIGAEETEEGFQAAKKEIQLLILAKRIESLEVPESFNQVMQPCLGNESKMIEAMKKAHAGGLKPNDETLDIAVVLNENSAGEVIKVAHQLGAKPSANTLTMACKLHKENYSNFLFAVLKTGAKPNEDTFSSIRWYDKNRFLPDALIETLFISGLKPTNKDLENLSSLIRPLEKKNRVWGPAEKEQNIKNIFYTKLILKCRSTMYLIDLYKSQ